MQTVDPQASSCSIRRSLALLGERWNLLIVREAVLGVTRFSGFRSALGIASDVLAARLAGLVDAGVLERVAYREAGSRARDEYRLTGAGREVVVLLGALADWGTDHVPSDLPTPTRFVDRATGRGVRVAFVSEDGRALSTDDVLAVRD